MHFRNEWPFLTTLKELDWKPTPKGKGAHKAMQEKSQNLF